MNSSRTIDVFRSRGVYFSRFLGLVGAVFQIIFNEISAAEISALDTIQQLELLNEFKVSPDDLESLEDPDQERFGKLERDDGILYRYRAHDLRIYFSVKEDAVLVHRVLHKNTFQDFLFRGGLPLSEDEALANAGWFWELIDEGESAKQV